ncbi:MAG: hypothetical protein AB7V13_15680 [Pseudorhodoplanes sp.]|uniref:hypothetical protein n=1 Tax=Pseudorhodoplanes sp. TaxID=1934341 RepID=UPI003D0F51A4
MYLTESGHDRKIKHLAGAPRPVKKYFIEYFQTLTDDLTTFSNIGAALRRASGVQTFERVPRSDMMSS